MWSVCEHTHQFVGRFRLPSGNRVLLRLSDTLAQLDYQFSLMRFLCYVKCFLLDNVTCVSVWSPLDGFIGCIMLYFCLLTEGEQWIIAIIKKSLQVSFLLSSSLQVHPLPCMSSRLLSPKMSKSWDKSIFWEVCINQFCDC